MKYQNVSYITVGSFVLVMLIGLMAMLVMITGYVWHADYYTVRYENVTGLSRGAPVTFEGFQIGRVSKIVPEHDHRNTTTYKVSLEIDKQDEVSWPIPDDSKFRQVSSGLLSTITVEIERGESSTTLEPNTDMVIEGTRKRDLMETLNSIGDEIENYKDDFRNIIGRLDNTSRIIDEETPAIVALVKSGSISLDKGIVDIVTDVKTMSAELKAGIQDMREVVGTANRESLSGFLEAMEKGGQNFQELSMQLQGSRGKLDAMLEDSRSLVGDNKGDVNRTIKDLQASIQVISQSIGAITHNLDITSRNLAEFSRQIRQNPGHLIRGTSPRDAAR